MMDEIATRDNALFIIWSWLSPRAMVTAFEFKDTDDFGVYRVVLKSSSLPSLPKDSVVEQ